MARGRNADVPTEIPAKGWWDIALRVKDEIATDRVGLIAAGVAFYGLLAIFPAITALLAIGGLLIAPNEIVAQLSAFSDIVPDAVMTIITDQATAVAGSHEGGLGLAAIAGILIAIYSASKGMSSLIEGMNIAYDEEESRGFFVKTTITLGLTILLILGVIVGLSAAFILPAVLGAFATGPAIDVIVTLSAWSVMLGLTLAGLAIVYRYGPSRDAPRFAWVSPGALVACILWIAGSIGFTIYVSNFGSYNESFGALAGVVILLMWLWISAFIILIGAELNAEMEAQTRRDTTVGKTEPMGERGAVKADTLGAPQTG